MQPLLALLALLVGRGNAFGTPAPAPATTGTAAGGNICCSFMEHAKGGCSGRPMLGTFECGLAMAGAVFSAAAAEASCHDKCDMPEYQASQCSGKTCAQLVKDYPCDPWYTHTGAFAGWSTHRSP